MLVLVFLVKKVSRLPEALISQLVNSNIWNHFCSSTVVKPTDVTLCLFFTISTRTSSMWCLNSILASSQHLPDNHSMNNWFIRCTISQWRRYPFFGTAFSTSSIRKTLICKWLFQNLSFRVTSWGILYFIELELKEHAFRHCFSSNGLLMPWHMRPLFSIAPSGFWRKKVRINLTVKTLVSGFAVCWFMVFAFLLRTRCLPSNITLTIGSAHSSSFCVRQPTSSFTGYSASHSKTKSTISSCPRSRCEFATSLSSSL